MTFTDANIGESLQMHLQSIKSISSVSTYDSPAFQPYKAS